MEQFNKYKSGEVYKFPPIIFWSDVFINDEFESLYVSDAEVLEDGSKQVGTFKNNKAKVYLTKQ